MVARLIHISIFILSLVGEVLACHMSESTIINVVDNGDGTYEITINVCISSSTAIDGGEVNSITITPVGGNFSSILSVSTSNLITQYDYGCTGSSTLSGGGNGVGSYTSASIIYTGTSNYGEWLGPPVDETSCIIDQTNSCQDVVFVTNGYPQKVEVSGLEGGGCVSSPELPVIVIPVTPIVTCSDVYMDSGGNSSNYSNDEDITTTYCSSTGGPLSVDFTFFDVENDADCAYDYMEIYDGPDGNSPLVGQYCGTTLPPNFVSSGECVTLFFHSDYIVNRAGWYANISCVCVEPVIQSDIQQESCTGISDGEIQLSISSGTTPYTYNWSTGATTQNISGLTAGNYAVTVQTNDQCTSSAIFTISASDNVIAGFTYLNTNCNGKEYTFINTGTQPNTCGNGCPNYTWDFGNGTSLSGNTDIAANPVQYFQNSGIYDVSLTVDNGACADLLVQGIEVLVDSISIQSIVTNETCVNLSDGGIFVQNAGGNTPYTYSWQSGSTLDYVLNAASGSYILTVTDNINCTDTFHFNVNKGIDYPVYTMSITNESCYNLSDGSIEVIPSNGSSYAYQWSTGSNSTYIDQLSNTVYELTITNAVCSTVESVTMEEGVRITSYFKVQQDSCLGNEFIFTYEDTINNSQCNDCLFQWTIDGSTYSGVGSNYAELSHAFSALSADQVILSVSETGCSDVFSMDVFPVQSFGADFTKLSDTIICKGEVVELAVIKGYNYQWNTGDSDSSISVQPAQTNEYRVTISNANNCVFIDTALVEVQLPQTISILSDNNVCQGDSVELITNGSGEIRWSTGDTSQQIIGVIYENTIFSVTVSDAICSTVTSTSINAISGPEGFGSMNYTVCEGDELQLIAYPSSWYQWNTGDSLQEVTVNIVENSDFDVTVSNTCGSTVDHYQVLVSYPTKGIINNDTTIIKGTGIVLSSSPAISYLWWSDAFVECASCQQISVLPMSTTSYFLETIDSIGCAITDTVTITVNDDYYLYIPNVFSPNNDGYSDFYKIFFKGYSQMEFAIYNRWGELVYFSTDDTEMWDGTYRGKEVNNGVFVYYLKAELYNGNPINEQGNITLVR